MSVIDAIIAKKLCGGGGGGGSVPKPLTYDYMPEGYPKKTMGTVTLMEEQEVAFTEDSGKYIAALASGFSLVEGQTYTVNWDGTEYECVSRKFNNILIIGNLSIFGFSENSGEPFLYVMSGKAFATLDTSSSHTISVKTTEEVATPMVEEFLPAIPADKLPAIPADKLPAIPADKLPAIPADKLEFPIVTLDKRLTDGITTTSPPNYNFTNFTFDELYDAVSKGFILIQDTSTKTYMPFLSEIFNGNIFLNIIINADLNQFLVNLLCSNGETYFSINSIKKITTSEI